MPSRVTLMTPLNRYASRHGSAYCEDGLEAFSYWLKVSTLSSDRVMLQKSIKFSDITLLLPSVRTLGSRRETVSLPQT